MSRVRLTQRTAADQTPYPGNVNQPDRTDPDWKQYHTFEQQVNHELPDMRHEWQDNPRNEIGFGEPKKSDLTVASVRVAANKAVRIAVLLLGEKVKDATIEEQARDLMAMNSDAMDRTLARFTATQNLYAEDKTDEKDEKKAADEKKDEKKAAKEEDKDEKKAADEKKDEEKKAAKEEDKDEKKAADEKKDEEKKAAKKDDKDDKKASIIKALQAALEDLKKDEKDEKKASDDLAKGKSEDACVAKTDEKDEKKAAKEEDKDEKKAADEKKDEEKKAAKEEDKDEKKAADEKKDEEKKAGDNDLDIEMTGAEEDELTPDPEADERLASLFATDEQVDEKEEKSAKKAGIKKLGGQPKVASVSASTTDISSIWNSAPDVSAVFGN